MFSLKPEHPKPCPARVFDSPRGSYPDAVHVALSASFRPGLTQVSHLRFEPFTRGATRPKNTQFTIYTHFPLPYHPYTTPTPDFPEFRKFHDFGLIFERDSCIQTPIFRWTPLPEAIPSRRKTPNFGQISPLTRHIICTYYASIPQSPPYTRKGISHMSHPILYPPFQVINLSLIYPPNIPCIPYTV